MTRASDDVTFAALGVTALGRYGDREAFVEDGRRTTYAQAADLVARIARVLSAYGVGPGTGVALVSPNRSEAWLTQLATYMLGARYSGLHPYGSVEDWLFYCLDAEASVLVVDPSCAEAGGEIAECAGSVRHVLSLGPSEAGPDLLALAESVGPTPLGAGPARPADLGWLLYTGGTTGRSKGVMLSQRALTQMVLTLAVNNGFPETPRYLATTPITHGGGVWIMPTLLRGGTVVMRCGFDPHDWLRSVQDEHVTFAFTVPTVLYKLLDSGLAPSFDLSSLETVIYAASPMSPARIAEAHEVVGPVFAQLYSQTESGTIGTQLRKQDHDPVGRPHLLESCGRACLGATVEVLDPDGRPVADGEIGEIAIRAGSVMDGYWKRPQETAEALRLGWLWTGDLARRDVEGYVYIVDRKKDMIVTGGFNVYAREVEDTLATHPAISNAAVIGIPDERWGESVTAFVVPRPGMTVDEEEVASYVRERKGRHQVPKTVVVVESLPLTAVGKVDKKVLRQPYWAGLRRQVH